MQQFTWTSRDKLQVARTGLIEAPTAAQAAAALAARAVKASAVLPFPAALPAASEIPASLDLSSIKGNELLQALREMVSLLNHGVSRQKVLTALGAATANPVLAEVLQGMGQRTQTGHPLYRVMAAWPALFDAVVQHLVRHGEGENRLPECIKAAHAYLEFKLAMDLVAKALQSKPKALTRGLKADLAGARLLACLSVGQRCGLPLDVNVALAAQQCGDDTVAARMNDAWRATQQAAQPAPGSDQEARVLAQALALAGVVGADTWRQAANIDLAATLHQLTQRRNAQINAAVAALARRSHQAQRLALRALVLGLVVVGTLAWLI